MARSYEKPGNVTDFFRSQQIRYPLSDFLLRLDLTGVLACREKSEISIYLMNVWQEMFPNEFPGWELQKRCLRYYDEYRKPIRIMSRGDTIGKLDFVIEMMVSAKVLSLIGEKDITLIETDELKKQVMEELSPYIKYRDKEKLTAGINEVLGQYFGDGTVLSESTVHLLQIHLDDVNQVFDMLTANIADRYSRRTGYPSGERQFREQQKTTAEENASTQEAQGKAYVTAHGAPRADVVTAHGTSNADVVSAQDTSGVENIPVQGTPKAENVAVPDIPKAENIFVQESPKVDGVSMPDAPEIVNISEPEGRGRTDYESEPKPKSRREYRLKYVKTACLLYLALTEPGAEKSRRERIREQWGKVFDEKPYSERAMAELNGYIRTDPDLNALNVLFKQSLNEVRNGREVRRIVADICVYQVLAKLPHGSAADLVINEALTMYHRFQELRVGKEEYDIEQFVKKLADGGETVDDVVSRFLWKYEASISEFYRMALKSVNSADNARRRAWWEEEINRKEKEVSDLQNQMETIKINTVFDLVEKLSSSVYNYTLSRLFRFAQGYDSLSEEEIRMDVNMLLQVFQLYGVKPDGAELLDKKISEEECSGTKFSEEVIPDMEPGYVTFPGWSVAGDTVARPIACKRSKEEA